MHWHEDLQFIYVLEGIVEVRTLDHSVQMQAGEAIFINKDVVHFVGEIEHCHYNSFLFPAYFLSFYAGSPAKDFVDSVITNEPVSNIAAAVGFHQMSHFGKCFREKTGCSPRAYREMESRG